MSTIHRNDVVEVSFDETTGIATLTLAMEGRANKIDRRFGLGIAEGLEAALAHAGVKGLVIDSAHKDFCVGADIEMVYRQRDPAEVLEMVRGLDALLRRIETAGVPVVAALTGSALGGGYELALACHRRIALDDPSIQVGLPEVSLGLMPGAGGTQRLPRRIGIQASLEMILQGKMVRAPKALQAGMVDELAPDREALRAACERWIAANPKAVQPWDAKGFVWPGGVQPGTPDARNLFVGAAAMLYQKTAGSMPAPETALRAVHEGSLVRSFDAAIEVEARHFAKLATGDVAKDMIRTFWFHRTAAEKGVGLPEARDPGVRRVAILGAGMMGAGLAYLSASKGFEVVVKDVREDALAKGRAHAEAEAKKAKHLGPDAVAALLGRITWTLEAGPVAGADLVIEAVVEDDGIKAAVTREVEPLLAEGAIFASNTSAIPISHLAKASRAPERFLGLHFFSPVEKMPLLEIIPGERTSDETLARALGFARKLGKLPIVVNDGYGFFTSRVFAGYLLEGAELVAEGHDPALVEWAAKTAGMVVPPLQVFDEVSLTLGVHAFDQRERYTGAAVDSAGVRLVRRMAGELDRPGKAKGRGFYDYKGKERTLWPGIADIAKGRPEETGLELLSERLIYAQIAEVGRALEEGIVRQHRDAEVGAIFGIGFVPASGGPLAWMDRRGLRRVVEDLNALAETAGERFRPAPVLVGMAERNERFF